LAESQDILKIHYPLRFWFYESPSNATMPLSNSLPQTIPFHELVISTKPSPAFYFQRQLSVILTS
jgi:hypothetical protein